MADSLNTPTLPKTHPGLSRRALMREMAAAGMLAAAPVAAVAQSGKSPIGHIQPIATSANLPMPVPSPRVRMNLLIEELFSVAREFNPNIGRWTVVISEPDNKDDSKCSVLIAALNEPMPNDGKAVIDWRQV